MSDLPPNVRKLMTGRVNSIEKLVVVAELGKQATRTMPAGELMAALSMDPIVFREAVRELTAAKLIFDTDGVLELDAADPDLAHLLRVYEDDPTGTIATLSAIALNRIRSMAHAFADAFNIRKKR